MTADMAPLAPKDGITADEMGTPSAHGLRSEQGRHEIVLISRPSVLK